MEGRRRVQAAIQICLFCIVLEHDQRRPEKVVVYVWSLFLRAKGFPARLIGGVLKADDGENLLETKGKEVLDGTVVDIGIKANPEVAPYNIMAGNVIEDLRNYNISQ